MGPQGLPRETAPVLANRALMCAAQTGQSKENGDSGTTGPLPCSSQSEQMRKAPALSYPMGREGVDLCAQ